ncbi:MAG: pyridoxamine 5'-phosphate oxidase family protein [Deltaproteobacteria bacterium]|nr:pyridoxamine 5'-phosphate oxidase family protein [Deltaproteobacteria bacterium]
MSKSLTEYFNKQPRLGVLSTSNKAGEVDSAYFGSPRMIDDQTVMVALGKNKTLANLQENPHACYMIMEPGKSIFEWKGLRIYMKMTKCETSGDNVDLMKKMISEKAGEAAGKMIYAAVTFSVSGVRPLADFGQGWEKSI